MANVTLPELEVNFKQLATTFIERSERGIAILIIRDNTDKLFNYKEYVEQEDLDKDKALYSEENFQYLSDILSFGVAKLSAIRIDETDPITNGLNLVSAKLKTGWIGTVGTTEDYTAINTWIKARTNEGKTYKALTYKVSNADHKHIINFTNPSVTFLDSRGTQNGVEYIPSLLAIACVCNVARGMTYYICKNLKEVEPVADVKTALNNGELILINDFDCVRVGTAINSLVTIDESQGLFDDMKYIEIIEATDMMKDDIRDIYKNKYVGACKNNLDNQIIFISAVNTYFGNLAESEILDNQYDNYAYINVTKQRKAWETVKPEAKAWDDTKVKNMSFKRSTFLGADVKVLGSMMNLDFDVFMA
ncbi:phage tail sheath C-terminal domain-containing protein [Clostridium chromiireducens]|uniref:phage tail sheath C-terminal domain-containing protein n=1 Tax=Clostridium chromiireducens TaxID=225345 RepID=UPI003AF65586